MFPQTLEEAIKEKGVTIYRIERDTGIKESTVRGWFNGKKPRVDHFFRICEYFGKDPMYFYYGKEGMAENPDMKYLCDQTMGFVEKHPEGFPMIKKVLELFFIEYEKISEIKKEKKEEAVREALEEI